MEGRSLHHSPQQRAQFILQGIPRVLCDDRRTQRLPARSQERELLPSVDSALFVCLENEWVHVEVRQAARMGWVMNTAAKKQPASSIMNLSSDKLKLTGRADLCYLLRKVQQPV